MSRNGGRLLALNDEFYSHQCVSWQKLTDNHKLGQLLNYLMETPGPRETGGYSQHYSYYATNLCIMC